MAKTFKNYDLGAERVSRKSSANGRRSEKRVIGIVSSLKNMDADLVASLGVDDIVGQAKHNVRY